MSDIKYNIESKICDVSLEHCEYEGPLELGPLNILTGKQEYQMALARELQDQVAVLSDTYINNVHHSRMSDAWWNILHLFCATHQYMVLPTQRYDFIESSLEYIEGDYN